MPETRLAKTRATLPEGYQFGERQLSGAHRKTLAAKWRAAADRADRLSGGFVVQADVWRECARELDEAPYLSHWNVIEGEH